jgi:hypothetical protein
MPRWAWNKAPVEAKRQFFELIRQGASGQAASLARISMVLVLCRSDRHGIWNALPAQLLARVWQVANVAPDRAVRCSNLRHLVVLIWWRLLVRHNRLIVRITPRSAVTTGRVRWRRVSQQQPHADR